MIARTSAVAGVLIGALFLPAKADASRVTDQAQPHVNVEKATWTIGGLGQQKLAQTVTAGLEGRLVEIRLPVSCGTGALQVDILALDGEFPSEVVLARGEVSAADMPPLEPPAWRTIPLDAPTPHLVPGQRFAIHMRNETGMCGIHWSLGEDPYLGGQVDKIPPGRALTLGYKALAGGEPGQFEIHTKIDLPFAGTFTDGSLKTFIDVEKEPKQ